MRPSIRQSASRPGSRPMAMSVSHHLMYVRNKTNPTATIWAVTLRPFSIRTSTAWCSVPASKTQRAACSNMLPRKSTGSILSIRRVSSCSISTHYLLNPKIKHYEEKVQNRKNDEMVPLFQWLHLLPNLYRSGTHHVRIVGKDKIILRLGRPGLLPSRGRRAVGQAGRVKHESNHHRWRELYRQSSRHGLYPAWCHKLFKKKD